MGAGRERRVANNGLGIGMTIMRVGKNRPVLEQIAESPLAEPRFKCKV